MTWTNIFTFLRILTGVALVFYGVGEFKAGAEGVRLALAEDVRAEVVNRYGITERVIDPATAIRQGTIAHGFSTRTIVGAIAVHGGLLLIFRGNSQRAPL